MQEPVTQNPALKDLEVLIGEWAIDLTFPADPPVTVRAHVSFDWFANGAFLVMRSGVDEWSGPGSAVCVIGRDDAVDTYSMLYYDARGVSRIYEMSLADGVWKQWRSAPEFSQRFTGTFSDDGNTITAQWEKSNDGVQWEHDFDLVYRRVTASET